MATIYQRVSDLESEVRWLKAQLKDGLSEVTKRVITEILKEGLEA